MQELFSTSLFFRLLLKLQSLALRIPSSRIMSVVNAVYTASGLCAFVSAFAGFADSLWVNSLAYKLLCREHGFDKALANSGFGRLWLGIGGLGLNVYQSRIVFACSAFAKNAAYYSSAVYGQIILAAAASGLALSTLFSADPQRKIFIAALGIGFLLVFLNRSFAAVLNGSAVLRFAADFFGLELQPESAASPNKILLAVLGLAFGAIAGFAGPLYSALAAAGLAGAILTMHKTQTAIYAAAFLLPLFPTKLMLGLALLATLSYLTKLLITSTAKLSLTASDFFAALFGILLVYSVSISVIPSNSAVMALTYVLFIGFYFTVKNTIKTRQQLFTIISLMSASGLLVAAIGIYQRLTGNSIDVESWIDTTMFEDSGQRIYSTLGNPNMLGEYLIFVIPLVFAGLYYFKNHLHKLASAGILALMAACLIFTQSRGAWLGLLSGMAVFTLLRDRRLILAGFLGLLISPLVLPQSIITRFTSIGNLDDSSTSYRVSIWLASTRMLADFWPIGIGLGTSVFIFIFQKYAFSASYALHSHNLYLQILLDTGIWGFLLFAAIILAFYKNLMLPATDEAGLEPAQTTNGFTKTLAAALAAGMTGFLVQGMTDNTWYNYRLVMMFWLITALAAALRGIRTEDGNV